MNYDSNEQAKFDKEKKIIAYKNINVFVLMITLCMLVTVIASVSLYKINVNSYISIFLFKTQDFVFIIPFMIALVIKSEQYHICTKKCSYLSTTFGVMSLCGFFLIMLCYAGRYFVLMDHDLSGDEQMVRFDAQIFSDGRLFWPIPPFWRPFASALKNSMFLQPIGDHEAWVSGYLPINASLLAAIGKVADPSLTSPLLVGVGFLALWNVAQRLWPDSPSTRAATLFLYAGSSQVVVTGMTKYAMSAHLALNLVWLALFLKDRRAAHFGAAIVGFLATGLHQPLFHPLFVLPFMGVLAARRRYGLLAFYAASYAVILAFWFAWPSWISSHGVGATADSQENLSFLTRLIFVLNSPDTNALLLMPLNLLRFITWQHLFLLPLLAIGLTVAWRGDPIARALAIGFFLPIPVMFVLLPLQGHGWGYRYLHGVIGNACLLAGYGWQALEAEGLSFHRAFLRASLATFLVVIPVHLVMARRLAEPFAQVSKNMAANDAAIVIYADDKTIYGLDLAMNRPDLSNRPIMMFASRLVPADMKSLCGFGSVAFVDADITNPINEFFDGRTQEASPRLAALEEEARRIRCVIVPPSRKVDGKIAD
jgi:hypothetical protein